eukprot:6860946-Alexandrium_andersonii.AAC.1
MNVSDRCSQHRGSLQKNTDAASPRAGAKTGKRVAWADAHGGAQRTGQNSQSRIVSWADMVDAHDGAQ